MSAFNPAVVEVVNGVLIQSCGCGSCSQTLYVNGHIVQPAWPVSGEAFLRAVRLACLAHREKMAAFRCGTRL